MKLSAFVLCVLLGWSTMALAQSSERRGVSMDEAIRLVKAHYDGKILGVKRIQDQRGPVYKVKLISSEGRVYSVLVNGQTGEVFRAD